jgi:monothiol glutaredoxin
MSLDDATRQRIDDLIKESDVMLFMKGNPQAPQCGFSATVIQILDSHISSYETLDVLSNPDIREGIKAYSSWPTIPQLYVKGEFVGGCDIIKELAGSGELFETLGVEPPPEVIPKITITDEAAAALQQAAEQHGGPGRFLHLSVSANFQSGLSMAERGALDVEVQVNGVTLLLDRISAARADGIEIEVVETPQGAGFKVNNPNAPRVNEMSVHALKEALDAKVALELIDVRTPREHEMANITHATLLTEGEHQRLEQLPKDTRLVFVCHHGPRAVAAAEHFISLGFVDVHNVTGGIEAWSVEIDSSVPRY